MRERSHRPTAWTRAEEDLIRSAPDWPAAYEALPNRSPAAIRFRAKNLRIRKHLAAWTPEENEIIVHALSYPDAYAKLPHRTPNAIRHQGRRLGIKKGHSTWLQWEIDAIRDAASWDEARGLLPHRSEGWLWVVALKLGVRKPVTISHRAPVARTWEPPARGSIPYVEPLWAEAHALVPRRIEEHHREDLISDMVLIRLEGRAEDMAEAFRLARRERNRMTGAFRERSLDAPLSGHDELRLLDMISTEHERF